MIKNFLVLILLLMVSVITSAQKAPVKFGKISKAELLNNTYAPDTSAPAVVLCDYGYFTANRFQTVRILRIKILKKEGYGWANQVFPTDVKTNISGITYNLVDNEIVESKLKNESIFKTRITDDLYQMRVAMPNVKTGSIIDIQFMFDGIPIEWDFQQEIPVVHSELMIEPSAYIDFNKNYFGYIPLAGDLDRHWFADNVPAFKPEPYITSSKNYRSRFEFDIKSISFPGYYRSFTTTWEAVRNLLYEHIYFGIALNSDGYLKSEAKEIKANCSSQDAMIKMAYEYSKKIKWDKTNRLFTDHTSLNATFKEGKGNSSEINLALVQLLRRLDFDAGPVIMSSRENGVLSLNSPSITKLDYVIAAVFTGKDTLLLDATETNSPYYLLPMRALNGKGQFIDKSRTGWIPLQANKKETQVVVYALAINDDLSLNGKLSYSRGDYAALDFRNDYENFNSEDEYLTNYKEGKQGLKIISHKLDNLDSLYKPIYEEFEVDLKSSINNIDGELYLLPALFEQMKENPFKASERDYPIDFGFARNKTIVANYQIPQGYSVANLPVNANLKLHDNSASFTCLAQVADDRISIIYKMNINKSIFLQNEYADLREFYNQIIAKQAEPVVLKRN